jgi:hypothetical protein
MQQLALCPGPMVLFPFRCFRPAAATRAVGVADAPEGAGRSCEAGPATQRVGKVISDGDERASCPCCRQPITGLSAVVSGGFPVRRSGRPRWLPTLPPGRHRIGQYVHLQQCARLAALAPGIGDRNLQIANRAPRSVIGPGFVSARTPPFGAARERGRAAVATGHNAMPFSLF